MVEIGSSQDAIPKRTLKICRCKFGSRYGEKLNYLRFLVSRAEKDGVVVQHSEVRTESVRLKEK